MGLDRLQSYIIGVILSIVVATGGILIMTDFLDAKPNLDSVNDLGDFNDSFSKANEVTDAVDGMSNSIEDVSESNAGILGWLNALVGSIFDGIKAIFKSFSFVESSASDAGIIFGIPAVLIGLIVLIITIIIVFAIWSAITKV